VASSEVVVTGRGCIWVDFAGVALGQVWVLNKKIHCRSLISIHILYNHTPAAPLRPHPELCCGLLIFHWTEVVMTFLPVCVSVHPGTHKFTLTQC
jgi:hypothetical protein